MVPENGLTGPKARLDWKEPPGKPKTSAWILCRVVEKAVEFFLQILGGLCLGVILLILLLIGGWWVLKRRIRQAIEGLGDLRYQITPARLHLRRQEQVEWKDPAAVTAIVEALRGEGFQEAGVYVPDEMDYLRIHALAHPAHAAYGVVYEHDKAGVWIDLWSKYENGDGITYTTAPQGQEIESPPGQAKVYEVGGDPAALFRRLVAERPTSGLIPTPADGFVQMFERSYAESMDWRNARGGPSEEEIRRVAIASGEEVTDEMVAECRAQNLEQAIVGLQEALRERFLDTTTLSAREWEEIEDRLTFVFDLMTPTHIAGLFTEEIEWNDEGEPIFPGSVTGRPARIMFERLNERLPEERRYRKIGELNKPVDTDVYVAPEEVDDVDE